MDRFPPLAADDLNEAQVRVASALTQGPRGGLRGPFVAMLRAPEFMDRAQRLGEYIRYDSTIPARLRELAIIVTAACWRQSYEWHVHAPLAQKAGAAPSTVAALARGENGPDMADDERVVADFCRAVHRDRAANDATFNAARTLLGEATLVELLGLCGYYAMLAMVLNVARSPLPEGAVDMFATP